MCAPQQEHCQCSAFIGRLPCEFERVDEHASTPSSGAALKAAWSLRAATMHPATRSLHSERRSDFHCVLSQRGRRDE